jgi:WD40 repeat protein
VVAATVSGLECRRSDDGALVAQVEAPHVEAPRDVWEMMLVVDDAGARAWSGAPAVERSIDEGTTRPVLPSSGRLVAITPDGRTALAIAPQQSYDYQELAVIDVATSETRGRIRNSREFSCLALADAGDLLVTADFEHDVKVWDLSRATTDLTDWEARGRVRRACISDDGGLALVQSEHVAEVWATGAGSVVDAVPGAEYAERFARCGAWLGDSLDVDVREEMGAILQRVDPDPFERRRVGGPVAVSHHARRAVTATPLPGKGPDMEEPVELGPGQPARMWVWDLDDLPAVRPVRDPTGWVTSMCITGDGRFALTGSQGRLLRMWDLDTGTCLRTMRGHRGMVFSCGISDDARFGVSGSEDMTVRLWDLEAGVLLFTFATASAVGSCDISPGGQVAIAGENTGRVHVFAVR